MTTTLLIKALPSNQTLRVVTADTFDEWTRGLSGHEHVPLDGMLFRFPSPALFRGFQTRDMLVPIDLAFICKSGKVRATYLNARPGATTMIEAARMAPTYRYVLETRAGLLAQLRPTSFSGLF